MVWLYALFAAVVIFVALLLRQRPSPQKLIRMGEMGFVLAAVDFVVQTIGFYAGLWRTSGSIFTIGPVVPIEVALIALIAGALLNLVYPKFTLRTAVWLAGMVGAAGAMGEFLLVNSGDMLYAGGWNSLYAFFGYAVAFFFFHFINSRFIENEVRL